MSDLWAFSSPSARTIVHHSSLSHTLPPFTSPSSFKNHGNSSSAKVTSSHLHQSQVTSPHLHPSQVTSPHSHQSEVTSPHLHQSQVTSPHFHQSQVTSPHFHQSQVTSPQLHQSQVTSPHFHQSQVTSPQLHQSQVTSSHSHQSEVTSPHLHQSQVTSPHCHQSEVTSPHLHQSQVTSPHLHQSQVTSPHLHQSQVTSPHLHQSQVTSPHLHQSQVTSPHLHQSQVTSPHLHQSQVTSPHLHQSQVTSPHLHQSQVTSPHLHQSQVTSPHLHQSEVTSPHFHPSQVTSPHCHQSQVTFPHSHQSQVASSHPHHNQLMSPHLAPQTQVCSSQFFSKSQVTSPLHVAPPQIHSPLLPHPNITSPHLMSQHLLFHQSPDPDYSNWTKYESSDLSDFLNGNSFSYQNQTTANLDHHLEAENQFSTGETHKDELQNPNKLHNTQPPLVSNVHLNDLPGPDQHIWGHQVFQQQCSPMESISGGGAVGRWSSIDVSSLSAQDFFSNQSFYESYHDNNGPQPFCSPTTPGPSPHYPQTPAVSSPGPQLHPRTEKRRSQTQTSICLNSDHAYDCGLKEFDCYLLSSDTIQQHPRETSEHVLLNQTEPVQEMMGLRTAGNSRTSVSPEGTCQTGQTLVPVAGMTCKQGHEGGRRGGRRGGRDGRILSTWVQPRSNTEVRNSRLQCQVCKRDFTSLPALNGHMRSHSGFRSNDLVKKDMSPPAQNPVSMVMPVSVPVQTKGMSLVHEGGDRRGGILPLVTRVSVLYRSLMRLEKDGNAPKANKSGMEGKAGGAGHYTPPTMLCPQRAGAGLYCSLATRRPQRVQTVRLHNGLDDSVATTTACPPPGPLTSGIVTPHINLGRSFQADIPFLQNRKHTVSDSHNALLLWTPLDKLQHPFNQQRVESLLMMTQSSVMPGGGDCPEHVLNILSESRGDFLLTLEKLLLTPETGSNNYTSVKWSPAEKKLLVKSLKVHHKDFNRIQKAVQTKSLSQCVEFYYLWKKKLSLSTRNQAGLTVTLPDTNDETSSKSQEAS